MSKKILAIANCRVSSDEQLQNNSLNRQRLNVLAAAERLDALIPEDGWWSGSVSSKRGNNIDRKDIREMLDYCKHHKEVKYLIVDEPDRFMRSVDEAYYIEMQFKLIGVTVWYASDDDLNSDNMQAKIMKFMKYFVAEGSNEERQRKSISGQSTALKEGRYTFHPKPGYMRGSIKGIPEVHPTRGPALQKVLKDIVYKRVTPTQGLINLNNSEFMNDGHSQYKMDKFRKIVTDPFYAGILVMDRQVKVHNENGLHEKLISKEEHLELVRIMDAKKKTQIGPRKNGNPRYPASNLITCKACEGQQYPRFVGYKHSNGSGRGLIYEKYRCRACKRYLSRDEMHDEVERQFNENPLTEEGYKEVIEALKQVWKREEAEKINEAKGLRVAINGLEKTISDQVEKISDDKLQSIHDEILKSINDKKQRLEKLKGRLFDLENSVEADESEFLNFAYDFIDNMGKNFLNPDLVSKENRVRCKNIVFPAGFYMNADKKVYTPEISLLYRLARTKKDTEVSDLSHLVRVKRL